MHISTVNILKVVKGMTNITIASKFEVMSWLSIGVFTFNHLTILSVKVTIMSDFDILEIMKDDKCYYCHQVDSQAWAFDLHLALTYSKVFLNIVHIFQLRQLRVVRRSLPPGVLRRGCMHLCYAV